jgi:hypothetical protein
VSLRSQRAVEVKLAVGYPLSQWTAGLRSCRRFPLFNMARGSNLAAARAAAQARRKKKTKTKTKGGRAGGRNFVTATAAAAAAAAAAEETAAEETAEKTAAEAEAAEAEAAEAEAAEAEAAEARSASGRHARKARTDGSVAEVNASRADKVAFAEAELMLTVEQVALRKMRAQGHGWVCALWVQKQLRVFLARDLDGGDGGRKEGWIEEVVAGGRKERAPVRVAEGRLESQRLVVMDGQEFFFFDIDGVDLFSDLGGDKKAEPVVDELEPPPPVVDEPEPPPVHCQFINVATLRRAAT